MKNSLINYRGKELAQRTVIILFGVMIQALSITIMIRSNIGVSPVSLFNLGVVKLSGLSYGNALLIFNSILLIIVISWNRKEIRIGTFIITFFMGPLIDIIGEQIVDRFFATPVTLLENSIWFLLSYILLCLGIGIIISARMGPPSIETFILTVSTKTKISFKYVSMIFNAVVFTFGYIVVQPVSIVGTIFLVIATGPTIQLFFRLMDKILLKTLGLKGEYIK